MNSARLIAIVASTSAASFLAGSHFHDVLTFPSDFLPGFRIAVAATALVTPQPQIHSPQSPSFKIEERDRSQTTEVEMKRLNNQVEELEIWKCPSRASEIMRFGYPGFDNLRTYEDFVLSYDRRARTAHWVVEHLSPDRMTYDPSVDRSKCVFRPDESIHPFFQSQNSDYFRSGYDRGHLAAAGNHRRTQRSIDQTFFLTNMSPQVGKGFNRDKWNDLEKHARRLARVNPNVYICSGPLYLPYQDKDGKLYVKYEVIGANRVAVPTHFFKVILMEMHSGDYELECYLMPNATIPDKAPISDFLVPLDTIERPAGFLIFERMPKDRLTKMNGQPTGNYRSVKPGVGLFRLFSSNK